MANLVHIDGKRIVNLDCVALATFTPEHAAIKEVYSDIDGKEHPAKYIVPDTLELILTPPADSGYSSSEGMRVKVTEENARHLWRYLESRADIPNMESAA